MVNFYAQVARGVAFLDEVRADDWREAIIANADRLEMTSPSDCILGIIVGNFWGATRAYSGADPESATYFSDMHEWAARRGFVVADEDLPALDADEDADVWTELQNTWLDELGI